MKKVHILDRCEYCDGEAYVFVGEYVDADGQHSPRYLPCHVCKGSGELDKWVSLQEFADLLDRAVALEPDWLRIAHAKPLLERLVLQSKI